MNTVYLTALYSFFILFKKMNVIIVYFYPVKMLKIGNGTVRSSHWSWKIKCIAL